MDEWLVIGIIAAAMTAGFIAWGLRTQRRKPGRRWPILAVGLLAGLAAGLAMLMAIWAEGRWPHRRRLIDAVAIVTACGLVLGVAYEAYGPPFGIGPTIEAGRIERPLAGYALTLPEPWRVEDTAGVRKLLGEEVPTGVAYDLLALESDAGAMAAVMVSEDDLEMGPRAMADLLRFSLEIDPDFLDVASERLELPAGTTFRVDVVDSDGLSMSVYLFSGDGRCYYELCLYAIDPPDDRWRSIAETFEFLSADV